MKHNYTGRSRKKYVVMSRHAVRAQLPDGRKKPVAAGASR